MRFLQFLLIVFILALIGMSIGFLIVYLNLTNTVLEFDTNSILGWLSNTMKYLRSGELTKHLPFIQSIVTTISGFLGIIVVVKQLKKK